MTTFPTTRAVTPVPEAVRDRFHLDAFYQQYLDDEGLPILASAKCSPFALLEARYVIDHMLAHRPEIRTALIASRVRLVVMATTEMTTDVPEQRGMTPRDFWDRRARGLGGRLASCAEENLLRCPGDPYFRESILIHEFSHVIADLAMQRLDKQFDSRVQGAFEAARKTGAWAKSYAATNRHEYFAEGAQAWFDAGRLRGGSNANNGIGTRERLKQADPGLAGLCAEVFGDDAWRYIPPDRRDSPGHLSGLDRAKLPPFAWPTSRPTTQGD